MEAPHTTLALFAKFITRTMGLHFTEERLFELDQKMVAVARDAGYPDSLQYQLWLMSAPLSREQLDTLARALTIGETYFLRDPRSYQVLEEELIPGLLALRRGTDRSLRIWSAGCSSGEEPYTLAILLSRAIPDLANWNISLVATDINPQALERGRRGIYSQWSFRNSPAWLMDYFGTTGNGRYEIIPRIKAMVRFDHLNLADDTAAAQCAGTDFLDIIFCRNVMLYFDPPQIERTIAMFHAALRDGGWLFVGPTEVDPRFTKGFTCLRFPGAFVLRKGVEKQETVPRHTRTPHPRPSACAPDGAGALALAPAHRPEPGNPVPSSRAGATSQGEPAAPGAAGKRQSTAKDQKATAQQRQPGAAHPQAASPGHRPETLDAHAEALALYQAGNYEQAADCVRRALLAGPQPAATLTLGARAFANVGRLSEAREFCEQAIASDRLSTQSHYLLSIILEQQGEVAAAATSLKNVLFIDQENLLAYFALGNLSRQAGNASDSERNFANALELLERRDPHEVLPEAEGMTAGHLAQIIRTMTKGRSAHE
jgi:chemotaxis protein methyltransferase CheR